MPDERDEHIIRAALAYRREQARRPEWEKQRGEEPPPHPGFNGHAKEEKVEPLAIEPWTMLKGKAPERRFIDSAHMLPLKNVVLLAGDGGTGKSLLALQLMAACTTGNQWIGLDVDQGPVLYLSAEDDRDEVHKRVEEICEAEGIDRSEAHQAYMVYMAGQDAVLAFENKGRMEATTLFRRLAALMESVSPMVLILDNLADVFAGNENNRTLAKQFIGLLRGLAIRFDCTIILLAHPSLSGLSSGTGTSGSTAWSNSVRSRLYLQRPGQPDEEPNARVLEAKKANYAAAGTRFNLVWQQGRFVRQDPKNPWDRVTTADLENVRALFASGLWRCSDQSQDWGGYAVAEVLDLDIGPRGSTKGSRSAEQNRLRADVMTYLALWERNGQIFRVKGLTAKREPTLFYSNRKQEERDENHPHDE